MNKILLIVPDKDLQERAEAYLSHINIQDVILESTHMYGTSEALAAKFDANIVIARGITGQAIKRTHRDIHFVDIAITSDDIIAALAECKRKNGNQRIALILSDTNTTRLQQLEEVTGLSIQPYYISDEDDIRLVIEDVKSRGIHSIIGGVTVCQYCQQMGLSAIKIRTGAEAMERAINEALNAAKSINRERTKTNLLRTLLNNNRDAIIAVDSDGLVIDMNNQANLIFHLPDEKKHPLYIQDIFSDADWINTLHTGEHSERLQTIDNKLMLVNRSPILVDSHQAGVLLTFQNTEEIRETEVRIRKQLSSKGLVAHHTFEHIVAVNSVMLQRIATAKKYSQVESSVLIMGETGTGKELFAQSIHNASSRCKQPFVAINCAALPEQLLESELFGYTEGSFSGASRGGKIGLFEQAHKGTVFLDEIGEMPIMLQAKLLRVLEEKEIRRIGDNKVIPVDIRIICATNINIQEKLRDGLFRPDLFYRINTLSIQIPPLRERPEDIETIIHKYIKIYSQRANRPIPKVTANAIRLLQTYSWPGNVRELRNFCERMVLLGDSGIIDAAAIRNANLFDGQVSPKTEYIAGPSEKNNLQLTDEELALKIFAMSNISKAELAKQLGISRTTLWRKMKSRK